MSKRLPKAFRHLFEKLTAEGQEKALRQLSMTAADCRVCKAPHFFQGPLANLIDVKNAKIPVRIVWHELSQPGTPDGWNHCGILHPLLSEASGKPEFLFESMGPCCSHNAIAGELKRDYEEVQRLRGQGLHAGDVLDRCALCGERRAPVEIRGTAAMTTPTGLVPLAAVEFYELDDRSDFNVMPRPPERWRFLGLWDMSKGEQSLTYRWRLHCPRCMAAMMPVGARAPVPNATHAPGRA